MLPDFPQQKQRAKEIIDARMHTIQQQNLGIFKLARQRQCFEGDGLGNIDESGRGNESEFEPIEEITEWQRSELTAMTLEELISRLDTTAQNFSSKTRAFMFKRLDEGLESNGRTIHGKPGEPLQDRIYAMMEATEISFDEKGEPESRFVIPPADRDRFIEAYKLLQNEPRYEDLMQLKREAWRAREGSRKLVD